MTPARPLPSPREPELPSELLGETTLHALEPETHLEGIVVGDEDLSGTTADGVTIRGVRLRATRLAASTLDNLELSDVELAGCDLANLRTRGTGWNRVLASTCRMTGLTLIDNVIRETTFSGCRIDLASFGGCRLQRVVFRDCSLAQSDFLEAELDTVQFVGCDLTAGDLRGARLRRCELRDCRLDGLQGVASLRGAAMPWADIVGGAALWAQALGLEVLDED